MFSESLTAQAVSDQELDKSANTALSSLHLGQDLNQSLDLNTDHWFIKTDESVRDISVAALLADSNASIASLRCNRRELANGETFSLANGFNKIILSVLAQDGISRKDYRIVVFHQSSAANTLASLQVNGENVPIAENMEVTTKRNSVSITALAQAQLGSVSVYNGSRPVNPEHLDLSDKTTSLKLRVDSGTYAQPKIYTLTIQRDAYTLDSTLLERAIEKAETLKTESADWPGFEPPGYAIEQALSHAYAVLENAESQQDLDEAAIGLAHVLLTLRTIPDPQVLKSL